MQREHLDAHEILEPARDYHPTLAGGDVLGGVKTEAAEVAERARLATVILSLNRVRAVFDDAQSVFACDREQLVHIARTAGEVNGQNRFGSRRDATLDVGG